MSKRKLEPVYDLPYDMVAEIFSHLPAKQICRLRCTNQIINKLTSTYSFSVRQSFNQRTIICGFLIQGTRSGSTELLLTGEDENSGLQKNFLPGTDTFIVGCNNGIVVYEKNKWRNYNGDLSDQALFILNPVTLQQRSIPRPTSNNSSFLLGSVMMLETDQQGDYNLVCFLPTGEWDSYVECHVYSSKTGRWMEESKRKFNVGSRNMKYERPVLVRKKIYLVSDCYPAFRCEPYIVAIDVEQKSSQILPLPVDLTSCDYRIEIANWGDSDSSLCLLRWCDSDSTFTIWVMEDENKWNWSKFTVDISIESMGLERLSEKGDVTCFTVINGYDLVFNIGSVMHVFELKDERMRKLNKEFSGGYITLIPYANTLFPI